MNMISMETLKTMFEARSLQAFNGMILPYRLYVPSSYDPSKKYPVLLFLHGAGERGEDNGVQLIHVIPGLFSQDHGPAEEAIVIAPQCPTDHRWVNRDWGNITYDITATPESKELGAVVELLAKIKAEYSTDEDRYYVSGISMGGYGTWDLISRHTELFAGAIPICGGADPNCAQKLKNLPIHTVHGTADNAVPFEGTKRMVEALRAVGSDVRFDVIQDAGHDVWTQASMQKELWTWLFDQRR